MPPHGGAVFVNVWGSNGAGSQMNGEGDTQNFGCEVTF